MALMSGHEKRRRVTLLHLSDTHNLLRAGELPDFPPCDVLCHTGDFSNTGLKGEFERFDAVLRELSDKFPHRIVVMGNHDVRTLSPEQTLEGKQPFERLRKMLPSATHVPLFESIEIPVGGGDFDADDRDGYSGSGVLRIAGFPWWPGHTGNFHTKITLRGGQPDGARFAELEKGGPFDVLMTHGPMRGTLDEVDGMAGNHWGSRELKEIHGRISPPLHLHGHIHEDNGIWRSEQGSLVVNSAMKNRWGDDRLQYPCHLITGTMDAAGKWSFEAESIAIR